MRLRARTLASPASAPAAARNPARRYLLSCARKAGCAILLGWEDVMAARPTLMLLLVASFMALDRDKRTAGRQHPQQQQQRPQEQRRLQYDE